MFFKNSSYHFIVRMTQRFINSAMLLDYTKMTEQASRYVTQRNELGPVIPFETGEVPRRGVSFQRASSYIRDVSDLIWGSEKPSEPKTLEYFTRIKADFSTAMDEARFRPRQPQGYGSPNDLSGAEKAVFSILQLAFSYDIAKDIKSIIGNWGLVSRKSGPDERNKQMIVNLGAKYNQIASAYRPDDRKDFTRMAIEIAVVDFGIGKNLATEMLKDSYRKYKESVVPAEQAVDSWWKPRTDSERSKTSGATVRMEVANPADAARLIAAEKETVDSAVRAENVELGPEASKSGEPTGMSNTAKAVIASTFILTAAGTALGIYYHEQLGACLDSVLNWLSLK
jgi:hypothetical protein